MRHFTTILGHEIRMLLVSPNTYIVAAFFLGVMGTIFTGILESYSKAAQEVSPAQVFFQLYFIPVLFMVPFLTMKCFAEERRLGTIETLLTTPVSTVEVVLGKYGATYFLYLVLWALTGGFFYILHRFAGDAPFFDPGPLVGGYLFIAVSGLMFVALGVLASSLSRSQTVAAILCFAVLLALIIGVPLLLELPALASDTFRPVRTAVEYAQISDHLGDFTRGVVDTRQVLYYLSGTILALTVTVFGVEARLLHA